MVEINIYTKFNYIKIKHRANIYFNKKYKWYNSKTVFAPKYGNYLVSLKHNNIRICYWDKCYEENIKTKQLIKNFIKDNFSNQTIGIKTTGKCDIFDELKTIKTIQL